MSRTVDCEEAQIIISKRSTWSGTCHLYQLVCGKHSV